MDKEAVVQTNFLVFTLVSLGALIIFAEYSALAPFIYTLF